MDEITRLGRIKVLYVVSCDRIKTLHCSGFTFLNKKFFREQVYGKQSLTRILRGGYYTIL